MTSEAEFLARMRTSPDDDGPTLVYADWLLARGDERGELILLDHRDRAGLLSGAEEIDRLLQLSAMHGFLRLPDDPCAQILPFYGGGSFPVQYNVDHGGHDYYLRWRYGFSIDIDDETVLETHLETLTSNEWTFRETTVILAIVSDAILRGAPLSELTFPAADEYEQHPHYHLGLAPQYAFPDDLVRTWGSEGHRWLLAPRDYQRWYALRARRQRLSGIEPPPLGPFRCACGIEGITCGVEECIAAAPG